MMLLWRKVAMALTGLFLCLFLVVHLSANALLLLPETTGRDLYNGYAEFLRESPPIKLVAYLLYLSILLHVAYAGRITWLNRRARPRGYETNRPRKNSSWSSRNMGWLGVLVLIFMVIHLVNFWARIKLGLGVEFGLDEAGTADVYEVAYGLFQNEFYVVFYTALMVPLAFHLHHGVRAAFRSLGFHHREGTRILAGISSIFAVVISVGFGVIPIAVYLR